MFMGKKTAHDYLKEQLRVAEKSSFVDQCALLIARYPISMRTMTLSTTLTECPELSKQVLAAEKGLKYDSIDRVQHLTAMLACSDLHNDDTIVGQVAFLLLRTQEEARS